MYVYSKQIITQKSNSIHTYSFCLNNIKNNIISLMGLPV